MELAFQLIVAQTQIRDGACFSSYWVSIGPRNTWAPIFWTQVYPGSDILDPGIPGSDLWIRMSPSEWERIWWLWLGDQICKMRYLVPILQLKLIQIQFSQKDNSSHRFSTLGLFWLWQYFTGKPNWWSMSMSTQLLSSSTQNNWVFWVLHYSHSE